MLATMMSVTETAMKEENMGRSNIKKKIPVKKKVLEYILYFFVGIFLLIHLLPEKYILG